jgi:hypothetical protein
MTTVSIDYLNDRTAKALDLEAEIRSAYTELAAREIEMTSAESALLRAQADLADVEAAAYMSGAVKAMVGEKSNAEQRAAALTQHLSRWSGDVLTAKIDLAESLHRRDAAKARADMLRLIVQTRAQAA